MHILIPIKNAEIKSASIKWTSLTFPELKPPGSMEYTSARAQN